MLAEMGILPEHLENKINELLYPKETKKLGKKKLKGRKGNAVSKESYVISVSLMPGCYRHLQISGNSTLLELHSAIIDAFDFMDDHAHAFFMDNRAWSEWDCYYMKGAEEYEPTTEKYKLCQLNLYKGMQFKYVFDFGDEWMFQCKVLRVLEEVTETPRIIKSKGEAPKQYGSDWEDDDWDEDWEDE